MTAARVDVDNKSFITEGPYLGLDLARYVAGAFSLYATRERERERQRERERERERDGNKY